MTLHTVLSSPREFPGGQDGLCSGLDAGQPYLILVRAGFEVNRRHPSSDG
ncbi:hypothetical protein PQQ86_38320 [Paraburkholderia sediminicola]